MIFRHGQRWTKEAEDILADTWVNRPDMSAQAISDALASRIGFDCTRNSVIGKARRMGLPVREGPRNIEQAKRARAAGLPPKRVRVRMGKKPRVYGKGSAKVSAKAGTGTGMRLRLPNEKEATEARRHGRTSGLDLERYEPSSEMLLRSARAARPVLCQWIEYDPGRSDECKCLRPVCREMISLHWFSPYCAVHHELAYRTFRGQDREAARGGVK